eukprot:RCo027652
MHQGLLAQHLHREDLPGILLADLEDLPVRTAAQDLDDVKVLEADLGHLLAREDQLLGRGTGGLADPLLDLHPPRVLLDVPARDERERVRAAQDAEGEGLHVGVLQAAVHGKVNHAGRRPGLLAEVEQVAAPKLHPPPGEPGQLAVAHLLQPPVEVWQHGVPRGGAAAVEGRPQGLHLPAEVLRGVVPGGGVPREHDLSDIREGHLPALLQRALPAPAEALREHLHHRVLHRLVVRLLHVVHLVPAAQLQEVGDHRVRVAEPLHGVSQHDHERPALAVLVEPPEEVGAGRGALVEVLVDVVAHREDVLDLLPAVAHRPDLRRGGRLGQSPGGAGGGGHGAHRGLRGGLRRARGVGGPLPRAIGGLSGVHVDHAHSLGGGGELLLGLRGRRKRGREQKPSGSGLNGRKGKELQHAKQGRRGRGGVTVV